MVVATIVVLIVVGLIALYVTHRALVNSEITKFEVAAKADVAKAEAKIGPEVEKAEAALKAYYEKVIADLKAEIAKLKSSAPAAPTATK